MKHLTPVLYAILGSLATIGLLIGLASLIPPSEAGDSLEERGSGRGRVEKQIAALNRQIAELADQIADQQEEPKEKKNSKTEIAKAHKGETTEKDATEPDPGSGPRD